MRGLPISRNLYTAFFPTYIDFGHIRQYISDFFNWVIFKVVYEEKMHTLYRFNTFLITRGHVISKTKHTKVRHQYCSYESVLI